jgi:hypothetical protein
MTLSRVDREDNEIFLRRDRYSPIPSFMILPEREPEPMESNWMMLEQSRRIAAS